MRFSAPIVALLALTGCEGIIAGRTPGPSPVIPGTPPATPGPQTPTTCDATKRSLAERAVRRLTRDELVATLRALFGATVMNDAAVQRAVQQLPAQSSVSNAEFDNAIIDVVALEMLGDAIVEKLFTDDAAVDSVLGGCPANDLARCTDALVGSFATRAFRQPPTPETVASIRKLVTDIGGRDGLKAGVVRVIISPHFHQHLELGVGAASCGDDCQPFDATGERLKLTSYEVAERLAYQLTGAPPDAALLDAARTDQLTDLQTHAQRLIATNQARATWRRVVTDWLDLHNVGDPSPVVAKDRGIDPNGFGDEAREELFRYAESEVFDQQATLAGFYTAHRAVPYTDRLSKLFGAPKSDTSSAVSTGHGGLLARPAILLSGNSLTSPILRGVFAQRKLLCNVLPPPDPNLVQNRLDESASLSHLDLSNRDLVTQVTSPQACSGCHGIINPTGFPLERFDAAGFRREREVIYDATGPTAVAHPIDTRVDGIALGDDRGRADDADGLMSAIAASARAQQCFAEAIIVNTRFRAVDSSDACLVNELVALQRDGRPVLDTLIANTVNDGLFFKPAAGVSK